MNSSIKNAITILAAITIGIAIGIPFAVERWNGFKKETAIQNRLIAEESSKSYKDGFSDGWIVGKADSAEGRARDGLKAIRIGKIHGDKYPGDSALYERGYHEGYNEGWHARNLVNPPSN